MQSRRRGKSKELGVCSSSGETADETREQALETLQRRPIASKRQGPLECTAASVEGPHRVAVGDELADDAAARLRKDARHLAYEVEAGHAYVRQQRPPVQLRMRMTDVTVGALSGFISMNHAADFVGVEGMLEWEEPPQLCAPQAPLLASIVHPVAAAAGTESLPTNNTQTVL